MVKINREDFAKIEVNGAYLMGIINSMNEENVQPYREKYNLTDIQPDKWYSGLKVIDFYDDIENNMGGMFDLVAIGMNIVKYIEFPPEVDNVKAAMMMSKEMHYGAWRNGHPGTMDVQFPADQHIRLIYENLPLPIDLVYGLCYGAVKRFVESPSNIRVERQQEGNKYTFDIKW